MDHQAKDYSDSSDQKLSCNEELVADHIISIFQDLNEEPNVWDVAEDQLMNTKDSEVQEETPQEDLGASNSQDIKQVAVSSDQLSSEDISGIADNITQLSFPVRLWMLVEDDTIESIYWSQSGKNIVIDEDLFQREVLQRCEPERIFETDSLKTFIWQLHLHGFNKTGLSYTCPFLGKRRVKIYHNPNFRRDQFHLIENIQRKAYRRASSVQVNQLATEERKMSTDSRQSTSRFILNEEAIMQKKNSTSRSPHFSLSMINLYEHLKEISEEWEKEEEGASKSSVSETNDKMQDLELTSSHRTSSDYDLMMPLNDQQYSMLLLALSIQFAGDNTDDEPDGEASNDNCEKIKKQPEA